MPSQRPVPRHARARAPKSGAAPRLVVPDRFRQFIFPNRMRELRRRHGYPKLLALAAMIPDISYIRLSKIERGEVVARPDEIVRIAGLLGVEPTDMLIDVDASGFDMAAWSEPFQDGRTPDEEEERFAVMLAAAMRVRRARSSDLTIAALDKVYGLPPVILSRIENAVKTLDRWNDATVRGLCRVFGVEDEKALRQHVLDQYRDGQLDEHIAAVADPEARLGKTRERVARLAEALAAAPLVVVPAKADAAEPFEPPSPAAPRPERLERTERIGGSVRLVPVVGAPVAGGLISPQETGSFVEAPRAAGPRAFGLRVCRPSLGLGLPGNAVVVADPDRFPASGGLAVIREGRHYRVVAITFDRNGAMTGHSLNPDLEIAVDALDPADVAAVLSAVFG